MSNFFWGTSKFGLRRHWVSWHRICKPIEEGGLGLRSFRDMQTAMQLKLGWRLLNINSKWSNFRKAKYAKRGDLWSFKKAAGGASGNIISSRNSCRDIVRHGHVDRRWWPWTNDGNFTVSSG
ncbi:hypothetical protein REPUB_Repub10bG0065900 [Reevesia pubescens]